MSKMENARCWCVSLDFSIFLDHHLIILHKNAVRPILEKINFYLPPPLLDFTLKWIYTVMSVGDTHTMILTSLVHVNVRLCRILGALLLVHADPGLVCSVSRYSRAPTLLARAMQAITEIVTHLRASLPRRAPLVPASMKYITSSFVWPSLIPVSRGVITEVGEGRGLFCWSLTRSLVFLYITWLLYCLGTWYFSLLTGDLRNRSTITPPGQLAVSCAFVRISTELSHDFFFSI